MKIDLNTRNGYNLACALRGPDDDVAMHSIKMALTCRLRHLAGIKGDRKHGYLTNDDLVADADLVLLEECIDHSREQGLSTAVYHYIYHMQDGAQALVDILPRRRFNFWEDDRRAEAQALVGLVNKLIRYCEEGKP